MKNSLNRLLAGIACTVLVAGLSVPAHAAEVQPEPYTIQTTQWSREDFSQDANPDVFTATYDRALYNAIRQTLVDGTSDTAPAYTMVGDSEYSAVKNLLARMEGVVRYEHHVLSAPGRFCSFSPNRKCRKMAGKGVQPLDNYTCRFCLSSLKQADKSGLDRLQTGKLAGV